MDKNKNEYVQKKINNYFTYLERENKEIDVKVLCGLVEQFAFDYEMDKIYCMEKQ